MSDETVEKQGTEETAAPAPGAVDLNALTKAQIVAHAAENHELNLDEKATKATLIAAVEAARAGVPEPETIQPSPAPIEHAAETEQPVPETPAVTGVRAGGEIVQRGEFLRLQEASREFAQGFGVASLSDLLQRVSSDGCFAQRVVEVLIGERFAA